MALMKIVSLPDPVLRRKAHRVTEFDKDFSKLVDDMIETMRDAPGVGLAAPQVDVSTRLIVVEYGDDEDEDKPKKLFVLANPEIISQSEEKVTGIEACLSVPGLVGDVDRFEVHCHQRPEPPRETRQSEGARLAGAHLPA